jgi:hypothetical protein
VVPHREANIEELSSQLRVFFPWWHYFVVLDDLEKEGRSSVPSTVASFHTKKRPLKNFEVSYIPPPGAGVASFRGLAKTTPRGDLKKEINTVLYNGSLRTNSSSLLLYAFM